MKQVDGRYVRVSIWNCKVLQLGITGFLNKPKPTKRRIQFFQKRNKKISVFVLLFQPTDFYVYDYYEQYQQIMNWIYETKHKACISPKKNQHFAYRDAQKTGDMIS